MMKKHIVFIINPISGDIKKAKLPSLINEYLNKDTFTWDIQYTKRVGHAKVLAREAASQRADIVVAVGGDGSINEVANGLVSTNTALAIIPLGSGNGIAYHLKLPVRNIVKALKIINTGKIVKIDTLSSNYGEIVGFAGLGLEALITRLYRHMNNRGFLAYTAATLKAVFFDYKPEKIEFKVNGSIRTENVYSFSIYNVKYLGYKVGKIEKASLTDGKLNIVLIKKFPLWKLTWIAILELSGKMYLAADTEIIESDAIEFKLNPKTIIQIDGDSILSSQVFKIKVNPLSLNVLVPDHLKNY